MFNVYDRVRNYLANHKKLSLFLSHGALHIVVLIILIVTTVWIGNYVYKSSIPNSVIIDTSFEFLDKNNTPINSPISYINIDVDRCDSVDNKNELFKFNIDLSHSSNNFIPYDALNSKVYWTWNNYLPNNKVNYKLTPHYIGEKDSIKESLYNNIHTYKRYNDSIKIYYHDTGFTIEWNNYLNKLFNTRGNLLGSNVINPYYSLYFKINCGKYDLNEYSEIIIDLSDKNNPNTIITFDNIIPKPSEIGINKFSYKGKAAVESVLSNGGFYFDAKNTTKGYIADRLNLIFNVLMGTLIAFILDIIINLIYKWRKLNSK